MDTSAYVNAVVEQTSTFADWGLRPGEWLARREPDRVVLERTHTKADVSVRGPAAELLLVLCRRRPLDAARALELQGDRALLRHWIEHMDRVSD